MSRSHVSGFTIIELLVVVGILLVISGLAAENFTEAQVRAKVSRVRADLRIYATAVETYAVDNNSYPRMRHFGFYFDPNIDVIQGQRVNGVFAPNLTTPISYLDSVLIIDPFMRSENLAPLDQRLYTYQDLIAYTRFQKTRFWFVAREFYGDYRMCSVGPDRNYDNNASILGPQIPYDATNGTISSGNIWRSQKFSEAPLPAKKKLAD